MKVLLITPLPEDKHHSNIPFNKTYPIGTVFEIKGTKEYFSAVRTRDNVFYLTIYEQKHFKIIEED